MNGNIYRFGTKQAPMPGFSDAEDYCQSIDLYGYSSLQEQRFFGYLSGLNVNDLLGFGYFYYLLCFDMHAQLRNLCISRQRMCLHMRAGCGSIPAYAAI
jgi:hypothetical protein